MNADLCFKFSKADWEALSKGLDDNDAGAWEKAIGVFERRMKERFFSCIDALEQSDTRPDSASGCPTDTDHCIPGFSIMAICCLLVETLQSFREKTGTAQAKEIFKSFLSLPAFEGAFCNSVAELFYYGIRNGIVHEGETRRWVIWRDEPSDKIVVCEGDGYALNRTRFCAAVKIEFKSYLKELHDPKNEELRMRFRKKMNDVKKVT